MEEMSRQRYVPLAFSALLPAPLMQQPNIKTTNVTRRHVSSPTPHHRNYSKSTLIPPPLGPRRFRPPSSPHRHESPSCSISCSSSSFERTLQSLTNLFPLWVLTSAVVAFIHPPSFFWFRQSYIIPTLSFIMLGMGLTISPSSFTSILSQPRQVMIGVLAQYTIMPMLGFLMTRLTSLPPALSVGVILVCVCPGGAASNVVCLLAGANVPLSVLCTLISTLLSIFCIPFFMHSLASTLVPVNPFALFSSTLQIVLLPLCIGAFLRMFCKKYIPTSLVNSVLPFLSVLGVTAICAAVVATNKVALTSVGPTLVLTVALVHALGGMLGFVLASIARLKTDSVRTIAVEVMMQNSSLAVTLANAHFANPVTAVPGAVSATLHSLFGSIIAGFWRWRDSQKEKSRATLESELENKQ